MTLNRAMDEAQRNIKQAYALGLHDAIADIEEAAHKLPKEDAKRVLEAVRPVRERRNRVFQRQK